MSAMLCIRLDISFPIGMVSGYQSNLELKHSIIVKHILKYLKRTMDYMFLFQSDKLGPRGYINSYFQSDKDSCRFTFGFVFIFSSVVVSWRRVNLSRIVDSTMDVEYVVAFQATQEVVWLKKFLMELEIIPLVVQPMILFCDNSGVLI